MLTKEEYLAKMKAQLDEWQVDLEALGSKASEASEEAKVKVQEQITELRAKWDEGHARREEIKNEADEKWEELKDEAEVKWEELKVGVKDSIERVKSYFS
ncbi:hypothetical protein [uncultured Thiodictyon sp.]|uniref:hypothetical protein n=1 Tax=uncultured Thiodictyon sp. TaxID=1846217 RepID=UPI0025D1FC19|nr:hypothetical protein [uncultured Thiodictyon sp.]